VKFVNYLISSKEFIKAI